MISLTLDRSVTASPVTYTPLEKMPSEGGQSARAVIDVINKSQSKNGSDWSRDTQIIYRKYMSSFSAPCHLVFDFVQQEDKILGYTIARSTRQKFTAYLAFLVVDVEHQKQGLGSGMLDNVINKVKKLGYTALTLDANDELSFYSQFAAKREIKARVVPIAPGHLCQWNITLSLPSSDV